MEHLLTDKQERFCREYLIDCNATQAAIRAGYSDHTANEQGPRLLTNTNITDRIAELRAELNKHLEDLYNVDRERVLRQYARIAFSDIRCLFNTDGSLKKFEELDDDAAAVLQQVDVEAIYEGYGDDRKQIGRTVKVRMYNKLEALSAIAKVMGYYAPAKKEHKVGLGFLDFMKKASKPYIPDADEDEDV